MILSPNLPADIHFFFSEEKMDIHVLLEGEREIAKGYGAKRFADFCTGRYCLRRCTEAFGFTGDILIGERGMPLLPRHITASLSHSKKLAGAIAGHKDKYLSVGLDIETCGRVHKDMWYLLFTGNETAFLNSLDDEQRTFLSAVFFSMKEAFYKLQYPLTGIFLDFTEVEIVVEEERFYVKTLRHVTDLFPEGRLTEGKIIQHNDQVITYCIMPA
jgi:4'-phosphopantetheinyl transferase EntD